MREEVERISPDTLRRNRAHEIMSRVMAEGLLPRNRPPLEQESSIIKRGLQWMRLLPRNERVPYDHPGIPSFASSDFDVHGLLVQPSQEKDSPVRIKLGKYDSTEIIPEGREAQDYLLGKSLYGINGGHYLYSLFGVLEERRGEIEEDKKDTASRVRNSVVAAIPVSQIPEERFVDRKLGEYDVRVRGGISDIPFFIVPMELRTELRDILEVEGDVTEVQRGDVTEVQSGKKKIFYVPDVDKSKLFSGLSHKVPNYESALKLLANEINEPLFFHGIRLPTLEDVAREE